MTKERQFAKAAQRVGSLATLRAANVAALLAQENKKLARFANSILASIATSDVDCRRGDPEPFIAR
jgi:hypothetical protein